MRPKYRKNELWACCLPTITPTRRCDALILGLGSQSPYEPALVALIVTSRDIHIGFILFGLGFNQEWFPADN